MIARKERAVEEQAHAAARMARCGYDPEIGCKLHRFRTLNADFHWRRITLCRVNNPLGVEMARKFFMACDVVAVCEKDIFHAAELFEALNQPRVKARHVDEHVTPGPNDQVT